jgi:hypothetical protein
MTLGRKTGGRKAGTPNRVTADIRALAQRHGPDAVAALVDLMHNAERDETKLAAASALLDRGYGKPTQAIEAGANSTQIDIAVSAVTDEQRVAALMTMIARAKSSGDLPSGETRSAVASAYDDEISWHDDK